MELTMELLFCIFGALIFLSIMMAIALKIYLKLSRKNNGSYTCLMGKTAIITGANTGIGYFTALDFAKRGARVILACRNKDKAEAAQRKIIKATNNPNVIYKIINLSSFESVRQFAKDVNETEERLDILVNNAGAGGLGNHITDDGLQITLQINHISGFLLTHLLLDKLKKSVNSRIIVVSSVAAKFGSFDIENINEFPTNIHPAAADTKMYAISKLCNIYFTTELAKKLQNTKITVNTLHPGAVSTDIFRRMAPWMKTILAVARLYFKTPEEGAQTTIYLAVSKDAKGLSGKLFDNCEQIELYNSAKDQHFAKKLWSKFEELAKLNKEEKIN